jgi:hypothetical protein
MNPNVLVGLVVLAATLSGFSFPFLLLIGLIWHFSQRRKNTTEGLNKLGGTHVRSSRHS